MACTVSNHIVAKDEIAGRREPEIGTACECGRFIYLGGGMWHVGVTGRCVSCTHPYDDHPGCCQCSVEVH